MARTKTPKVIRVGDTVKYFSRKYVRGSRNARPGSARYTYKFVSLGVLLSKFDGRGHVGTPLEGKTEAELRAHAAGHIGLINATGASEAGDITEGNNPVLLPCGRVVWVYAEQVRPA